MAPVTRQAIRGTVFQQDFAEGRAGVQNGTYNRQVHMSNTWGDTSGILRIDCDGVSRPRFPASIVAQLRGTFTLLTNANGAPEVVSTAPFSYRVTMNAAFGMTLLANIPPVGFTVGSTVVGNPGYGNETVLTITSSTVGPEFRSTLDFEITSMSSTDESTTNFQMPFPDRVPRVPLPMPPPLHPDALAYMVAIAANGGTIRSQDLEAFGVFAEAVASIRSKILHYSPVAGNDLNAARVKFYRDSHEASNLLTFVNVNAGDYSPALGFQASLTRYINSGFTPNLSPMQDFTSGGTYSAGLGCWVTTAGSPNTVYLGARDRLSPADRQFQLQNAGANMYAEVFDQATNARGGSSTATGFLFGGADGNIVRLLDDGVEIDTTAKPNGVDIRPSIPMFFGAWNDRGNPNFNADGRMRHFVLTLGLTNAEVQLLSTAINTLQAVLAS